MDARPLVARLWSGGVGDGRRNAPAETHISNPPHINPRGGPASKS